MDVMESYVAYLRVSTQKQGRSGLGLAAQRELIASFVRDRGEVINEFIDIESGKNDRREALWNAIDMAKQIDGRLVIARLDRFSRRVSFIAALMEKGIRLSIAEMPDATDFQLHIFAALAQEERRLISVRTKAALQQAKARGTKLGSNGKRLAEQRRFERLARGHQIRTLIGQHCDSLAYSEIARRLEAGNVPTSNGGRWCAQSVKNCLRD
jgi:DNA invertase Pin-like site-specific DNA recombinase